MKTIGTIDATTDDVTVHIDPEFLDRLTTQELFFWDGKPYRRLFRTNEVSRIRRNAEGNDWLEPIALEEYDDLPRTFRGDRLYFFEGDQELSRLHETGEISRVIRDVAGEITGYEPLEDNYA